MKKPQFVTHAKLPEKPAPCTCTQDFILRASKNRVQLLDLVVAVYINGLERVGIRTMSIPKTRNTTPSPGMAFFKFCPWCGIKLTAEPHHAVAKINH